MIANFDDFCTWMYVLIDDVWTVIAPQIQRPGPAPTTGSDSELVTMIVIAECCGWDLETTALAEWRKHRGLFPRQPSQSRFNRRHRLLMGAINQLRQVVLRSLDLAQDCQCVIDSLPVPAVQFHLAPQASPEWAAHGAAFGKVSSKKVTIYGYKLHVLITLNGVILDFELAPANEADLTVGVELLDQHTDLTVLGDKGYISAPVAESLATTRRIRLLTIPRTNQKQQLPPAVRRLFNGMRQIIETVNEQLTHQFHIETNHAHTFWGLCARLYSKLTAHTLLISLNRRLGNPNVLQMKALVFPN